MSNHHKEQEHTKGHDHTHGEACGCGHDHHDHDHESKNEKHEGCNCGHDHHGHHHTKESETQDGGKVTKGHEARVYTIENLGCANCAAKMEKRISALPKVSSASITFATKELSLTSANQDRLLPEIEAICQKIENGVCLVAKEGGRKKEAQRSKRFFTKDRLNLISLILGGIFFIGVEIYHEISGIETYSMPLIIAFVVVYLVLGGDIVLTAVKNLFKGQVFDENFLMSVATLGAFAIAQYPEAVGVMLFFRIGVTFEHYAVECSRSQIMEAVDLRPETVNLLVGESVKIIGAEEAQVGDILLVR
ncbi:MAG: cation transporter, partial [Eubacterium aggregans]